MRLSVATRWTTAVLLSLLSAACSQQSAIQVVGAKAVATPPGAVAGAVYLELISASDDELLAVTTPVAERAEVHSSTISNGMMQMRPMASVALKAGQAVRFAPGGMHLMLMNLHGPLTAGTGFSLNLQFKNSADIRTQVRVVAPGSIDEMR